jgi:hypothetical protein
MLRIGRNPDYVYTLYNCQMEVEWMILVKMRPEELKDAVKQNIPIIMAAGVVEYHGPHLPIGTDFLIANAAEGRKWIDFCIQGWVNELSQE